MATSKNMSKKSADPPKKPIAQVRKEFEQLQEKYDKLSESGYCYMCDAHKKKEDFYVCTDPMISSGICPICRLCARKIACRSDRNGDLHEPTKESVIEALRYLNKPFLEVIWNASIQESQNLTLGKTKTNVWTSYSKNMQLVQYIGLTFKDSDMFKEKIVYEDEKTAQQVVEEHNGLDTYDAYIKNKADVKRLLDYDPFEKEPIADQPFLYSQLLGMLDASEDANEDMMRVSSAIEIVRNFLQLQKINDSLAKIMGDFTRIQDNSATIKSLQDSKQKLSSMITNLAAESCLSLKNSKSSTKGENTLTGRLRKLREIDLREAELNGFSVGTCKGFQQVAVASMSAIIVKLSMDESEWAEIVKSQRIMVDKANKKSEAIEEAFRILLRENLDLRELIREKHFVDDDNFIDLDTLLHTYIFQEEGGNDDNE